MAVIVNTPGNSERESDSGVAFILGVIVVLVLVALFVVYGLPALRANQAPATPQEPGTTNIEVDLSVPGTNSTSGPSSY